MRGPIAEADADVHRAERHEHGGVGIETLNNRPRACALAGAQHAHDLIRRAAGANPDDLGRRRISREWRSALTRAAAETRALFLTGRPLPNAVSGRLRWELRATWLGGTRILDRLERSGFDVFRARPTLGWLDALPIGWRALTWR